jgi:four helix bundle protein
MSQANELRERTERFAVAVVRFCEELPSTMVGRRVGQQLIDAGTSVAANYRAACRAYTRPLFISKLATVAEEADESEFWLRLMVRTSLVRSEAAAGLIREAGELTAIFTASLRTARKKNPVKASKPPAVS